MTNAPDGPDELELHCQLGRAIRRIRTAIDRCPAIDTLAPEDIPHAERALGEAQIALVEAQAITEALADTVSPNDETLQLVASSRLALAGVCQTVALLTTELDMRRSA